MTDGRPIRVLLADDQPLLRTGFRMVLGAEADLDIVGEAGDGAEAVDLARRLLPDVVLMDIRMPRMDGVAATRAIVDGEAAGAGADPDHVRPRRVRGRRAAGRGQRLPGQGRAGRGPGRPRSARSPPARRWWRRGSSRLLDRFAEALPDPSRRAAARRWTR